MKSLADRFDDLVAGLTIPPAQAGEVVSLGAEIRRAEDRWQASSSEFSKGVVSREEMMVPDTEADYETRRVPGQAVFFSWRSDDTVSAKVALDLILDFPQLPAPMEEHFQSLAVRPLVVFMEAGIHKAAGQASEVTAVMNTSMAAFQPRYQQVYLVLHELTHVFINTHPAFRQKEKTDTTSIIERTHATGRIETVECEVLVDDLLIEWGRRWLVERDHRRTVLDAVQEIDRAVAYWKTTSNAVEITAIHDALSRIFRTASPRQAQRGRTALATIAMAKED